MAVKCPNVSHPDWELSVRLFGLDHTLYLYDALGERVPNRYELAQVYKREKRDELSAINNPEVWDIEASEDLVSRWRTDKTGKRIPVKRTFTSYKADALIKQFRIKYPQAAFSTYKVETPSRANTRIRVSVPFDVAEPLYEQREPGKAKEAIDFMTEMLGKYSGLEKDGELNSKIILRDILNRSQSLLSKSIAKYLFNNQKELDSIVVKVNDLLDTAGEAGATQSTLGDFLRIDETTDPRIRVDKTKVDSTEVFFSTYLHEVMHHYTHGKLNSFQDWLGALEKPEIEYYEEINQEDFDGLSKMQNIADRIKRGSEGANYYGLKTLKDGRVNLQEFISEFTTNAEFRLFVGDMLDLIDTDIDIDQLIGDTFFKGLTVGDYLTTAERKDFNRKKEIMLETFPWVEEIIEDSDLVNKGQVEEHGRVIRVNPVKMSKDTIGHEFGHLLIDIIGGLENPLVKSALKQLENTPLAARIRDAYSDKTETVIYKEILAEAIGLETDKIFKEDEARNKWERWLVRFYERLKKLVGIEPKAVRKLANMVLNKEEFERVAPVAEEIYEQKGLPDYVTKAVEKAGEVVETPATQPKYLEQVRTLEDTMGELRNEIVDKLRTKVQIYQRKGDDVQVENLKRRIDEIEFNDSKMEGIRNYIRLAASQTSSIHRQYLRAKKEYRDGDKKALTAKNLQQWADYVSAFDLLEGIELAIIDKFGRDKYENSGLLRATRSFIQTAISRKNEIKSFLETEGTELVAEWLEPYVSRITAEYRLIYEREWRSLSKTTRPPKDEYIEQRLSKNEDLINTNTKHVIRAELKKGEFDIGYAYRMGETILDSDDIVIGAMAKAFALAMDKARREGLDTRDDIVEKLRKLEDISPQAAFKSAEEFYDFIIEKDAKGKYSNKLVGKFRSEFWDAREEMKDEADRVLEETLENLRVRTEIGVNRRRFLIEKAQDIRDEVVATWTNKNAPIAKDEMLRGKLAYIDTFLTEGRIDTEEHDRLKRALESYKYIPLDTVIDKSAVVALIEKWGKEHVWEYRNPTKEWESKQYEKLMKLDLKDPRREFYELIRDISNEGDKHLPFRYRLRQSLPFMPKTAIERLTSGQGMYGSAKAAMSDSFVAKWFDVERGQLDESGQVLELIDENNNPKMFLPVYYTPKRISKHKIVDGKKVLKTAAEIKKEEKEFLDTQSFDIASIYYNWFKMALEYKHKNAILPEMELTKHLIENRQITKLDSKNNPIQNANDKLKNRELTKSGMQSMLAAQLNDWFESVVYGKGIKDEGTFNIFGKEFDKAKTIDKLNKYTAYNLLGLNLMQGVANKVLGETMQIAEMFAGVHYGIKDYRKAAVQYNSNLAGILGDVGSRKPNNIINLLIERFDILHDYSDPANFEKSTRFRQLMQSNTVFFMAKAGEHSMQAKAMLAILNKMNAMGKDGKVLKNKDGSDMSLFDAYKVVDGKLVMDERVDITQERLDVVGHTMKRILSRMHGEYSDLGSVALQRSALGRMAYMFRKFMIQGWKRRMEISKRKNEDGTRAFKYNEVGEFFTEGAYRSTAAFLRKMTTDWALFKQEMWSKNWDELTSIEIANIKRTITEATALVLTWTMAHLLISYQGDDEDDNVFLSHGIYQALRLKSELAFFVNPIEAMKILRSPAASMSVVENVSKALSLLNPFDFQVGEKFKGGPWDDQYKIWKYTINATPVIRQGRRITDIENQLNWWK